MNGHKIKIVINVDDLKTNRFVINKVIHNMCYQAVVHDCSSVAEAIETYDTLVDNGYEVSLIMCDYHMPERTGKDLLKYVRGKNYLGTFAIITADQEVDRFEFPGADEVVLKPISTVQVQKLLLLNTCIDCMDCFKEGE
jgi:CheY-like chemotaxis protein